MLCRITIPILFLIKVQITKSSLDLKERAFRFDLRMEVTFQEGFGEESYYYSQFLLEEGPLVCPGCTVSLDPK